MEMTVFPSNCVVCHNVKAHLFQVIHEEDDVRSSSIGNSSKFDEKESVKDESELKKFLFEWAHGHSVLTVADKALEGAGWKKLLDELLRERPVAKTVHTPCIAADQP